MIFKKLSPNLSALAISGHSERISPGKIRSKVGCQIALNSSNFGAYFTGEIFSKRPEIARARALRLWPKFFKNHLDQNLQKNLARPIGCQLAIERYLATQSLVYYCNVLFFFNFELPKHNASEFKISKSRFLPENCFSCPYASTFEAIKIKMKIISNPKLSLLFKIENSNIAGRKYRIASLELAGRRIECNWLPIGIRFAKGWVHTIEKNE